MTFFTWLVHRCAFGLLVGAVASQVTAMPRIAVADEPLGEIARISVGSEPLGIDVTQNGQVIVVAAGARTLHVIDPKSLQETHKLDLSSHGRLSRVFVSQKSGNVFVSASIKGQVLKLDPLASSVLAVANPGGFPQGMAEVDGKLLVALTGGQAISVLDRSHMTPLDRLDAGDRPSSIHVDPTAGKFYVVKSTTRSIWVFDGSRLKWTHSISDPTFVRLADLKQAPDGRLLLLDAAQDRLLVMNASGAAIEARIPLLANDCKECNHVPMALAVSSDGGRVAVVGRGGWVSLIDLKTRSLIEVRQSGRDFRGVVWAENDKIFATSFGSGEVVVLDGRKQ